MQTSKKIAVAGATGRVGHHVVEILEARGHEVVAISRSRGVDIVTGENLVSALTGVTSIVDAATGPSPDEAAATEFFVTASKNLQEAGTRAGVKRIVVVSIIGIDKVTAGYNIAKLAHERVLLAGPIPARILRAAQFHEFVATLMEWTRKGDTYYMPKMATQLVAAKTVAEALADLALDEEPIRPGAPILEIAGPRVENLAAAARLLARHRGDSVNIQEGLDPANPDAERIANGALLPGPGATLAGPTFEEWLRVQP